MIFFCDFLKILVIFCDFLCDFSVISQWFVIICAFCKWFICDFVIFVCDFFVISRKVYEKKISDLPLGINFCLNAIQNHYQGSTPLPIQHLKQMLIFILQYNHFTFNGKTYLQIHGTSMGTPFAPNYANIFMAEIEKNILENPPQNKRPTLWKHFIDDIFMVWPHGHTALHQFLEHINCLHETIKFTAQLSEKEISFLDTIIYVNKERKLESNLFIKPTDICTLLHKESFHPNNCKNSVIFSQALRYRRVITADENLKLNLDKLKSNVIRRGYTPLEINKQFEKVSKVSQRDVLFKQSSAKETGNLLPFVLRWKHCKN